MHKETKCNDFYSLFAHIFRVYYVNSAQRVNTRNPALPHARASAAITIYYSSDNHIRSKSQVKPDRTRRCVASRGNVQSTQSRVTFAKLARDLPCDSFSIRS